MSTSCHPKPKELRQFQESAVAVTTADVTVVTVPLTGQEQLSFRVANAGAQSLTGFKLAMTFNDAGTAITVAAAGAAFTTPTWPVTYCSADPTGLTTGATVFGALDVRGCRALTVSASAATNATTAVTIEGTAQ